MKLSVEMQTSEGNEKACHKSTLYSVNFNTSLTQGSLGDVLDLCPIAVPGVHGGRQLHQASKICFRKF